MSDPSRAELERLRDELEALRTALHTAADEAADRIGRVHPDHRASAVNLVHYLELRRHDVRDLQARLAAAGLSSLGRSESDVIGTLDRVLDVVSRLTGHRVVDACEPLDPASGHRRLARNATALLGAAPDHRRTRIMVTLPSEAAHDPQMVRALTDHGMDVARINCAHDAPEDWAAMAATVHASTAVSGERPRIAVDLAGPKLRTGPLEAGPRVVRVAPRRDRLGHVAAPAVVWLTGLDAPAPHAAAVTVPVDDVGWSARRATGERLAVVDGRGERRTWTVIEVVPGGCLAEAERTAYLTPGSTIAASSVEVVRVADVPPLDQWHHVRRHDVIVLARDDRPTRVAAAGEPHLVGCTLPAALDHVRVDERVWFDDGKIGGVVTGVSVAGVHIQVTDVKPGGAKLRADKGINLPDSDLALDALTAKDLEDLDAVAGLADVVQMSFVRDTTDVARLQDELVRRGAEHVGVVLKIENIAAFERLPDLLLQAMCSPKVGVMIARGDLAVEVGFDRLAEVQEEILWACEAAHVPVIWATQVLDTMARTGRPSRAEITDAAMAERAECVMLNKGPHVVDAIRTLDSIISRMQEHQQKKRSLLRRLRAWDRIESVVSG